MYKKNDNVESPCNDLCTLDDENICLGCFRSLDEIIGWLEMDDKMHREILDNAAKRRKVKKQNSNNCI